MHESTRDNIQFTLMIILIIGIIFGGAFLVHKADQDTDARNKACSAACYGQELLVCDGNHMAICRDKSGIKTVMDW